MNPSRLNEQYMGKRTTPYHLLLQLSLPDVEEQI